MVNDAYEKKKMAHTRACSDIACPCLVKICFTNILFVTGYSVKVVLGPVFQSPVKLTLISDHVTGD